MVAGKLPPRILPPRKFPLGILPSMFLNIPTHIFIYFFIIITAVKEIWELFAIVINYLKDCFVNLFLKVLKSELFQCIKKMLQTWHKFRSKWLRTLSRYYNPLVFPERSLSLKLLSRNVMLPNFIWLLINWLICLFICISVNNC